MKLKALNVNDITLEWMEMERFKPWAWGHSKIKRWEARHAQEWDWEMASELGIRSKRSWYPVAKWSILFQKEGEITCIKVLIDVAMTIRCGNVEVSAKCDKDSCGGVARTRLNWVDSAVSWRRLRDDFEHGQWKDCFRFIECLGYLRISPRTLYPLTFYKKGMNISHSL